MSNETPQMKENTRSPEGDRVKRVVLPFGLAADARAGLAAVRERLDQDDRRPLVRVGLAEIPRRGPVLGLRIAERHEQQLEVGRVALRHLAQDLLGLQEGELPQLERDVL